MYYLTLAVLKVLTSQAFESQKIPFTAELTE